MSITFTDTPEKRGHTEPRHREFVRRATSRLYNYHSVDRRRCKRIWGKAQKLARTAIRGGQTHLTIDLPNHKSIYIALWNYSR